MSNVLLVRCRSEVTAEVVKQLSDRFGEVDLIDVEPETAEELAELCQ